MKIIEVYLEVDLRAEKDRKICLKHEDCFACEAEAEVSVKAVTDFILNCEARCKAS